MTIVVALAPGAAAWPQTPDLIIHNARVVTLNAGAPLAQAIAIAGDRFVAIGSNEEVRRLAGSATRLLDLGGRTVIPGLGDNHYHGIGGGPGVDLSRARKLDDVLRAIAERAAVTPQRDVIVTNSDWHEGQLTEQRLPYRDDLDRAAPDHPVVVVRGGHEYILNSAALRRWKIDERTPAPAGGKIGRYPDGRLNGELVDRARSLVELPRESPRNREETLAALADEFRRLNAAGLTAIRYAGISPAFYRTLQELRRRGLLSVRVTVLFRLPNTATPENLDSLLAIWDIGPDQGDDWLRVGGIKLGVDGGFEGGWMREPYAEPWGEGGTFRGLRTVDPQWYRQMVIALNHRGWRVATHAVGDAAIDLVLDAYQAANRGRSIVGRRWAIEHAFIAAPDQLPRMRALGLAISAQDHLYVAAPSLVQYWGRARTERVTPVRTYLDAELAVSSGTDSPVIPHKPFWTLAHFITRRTISAGVMGPEQRITREEALRLATFGHAYLTFTEERRGTIEPGKLADLVAVSEDILTGPDERIESIEAVLTIVAGKIVHHSLHGDGR